MTKVVVLGSLGMAGHIMAAHLASDKNFQVLGIARAPGPFVSEQLDILDFSQLEKTLERMQPDHVINCIGVLVKKSADDICSAILINSYLPHFLSRLGKTIGFKLTHISTDCVFSGTQGGYREDSFRDGDDNYARTKALGEVINERDLTIRTSIVGPELKQNGTGLLDWFLKQEDEIKGYTKAYWSGVTTLELAKATHELIQQKIAGIVQLSPDEKISKYELLRLFSKIWNKKIRIVPTEDYEVDKSLVSIRKDFQYTVPGYEQMLDELNAWMTARPGCYPHYRPREP